MSGFKYPYTCDKIDQQIGIARSELILSIKDAFHEFGLKNVSFREHQEAGEILFSSLSEVFEKTRNTNEEMRCAADVQILSLEQEIIELRAKLFIAENKLKEVDD